MNRLNHAWKRSQIENFFACDLRFRRARADYRRDSIAELDEYSSKLARFTKFLLVPCKHGATIAPSSAQFPFSRTQFGPRLRNIFAPYSVMRETFTSVHSSIPVQLFRAAPG
jgi:hypothetical protein